MRISTQTYTVSGTSKPETHWATLLLMFVLCSESSVKRLRKEWNLKKTRQQKHTLQTIHPYAAAVKERFPQSGAQDLTNHLRITYNIRVPRCVLMANNLSSPPG